MPMQHHLNILSEKKIDLFTMLKFLVFTAEICVCKGCHVSSKHLPLKCDLKAACLWRSMLPDDCNLPMPQACFWTQTINLQRLECEWVNLFCLCSTTPHKSLSRFLCGNGQSPYISHYLWRCHLLRAEVWPSIGLVYIVFFHTVKKPVVTWPIHFEEAKSVKF